MMEWPSDSVTVTTTWWLVSCRVLQKTLHAVGHHVVYSTVFLICRIHSARNQEVEMGCFCFLFPLCLCSPALEAWIPKEKMLALGNNSDSTELEVKTIPQPLLFCHAYESTAKKKSLCCLGWLILIPKGELDCYSAMELRKNMSGV